MLKQNKKNRTKRELLSQIENSSRVTLEKNLEVHRRRLVPKKLNIRRSTKLGKKIRTLISIPKGVINQNISLLQ